MNVIFISFSFFTCGIKWYWQARIPAQKKKMSKIGKLQLFLGIAIFLNQSWFFSKIMAQIIGRANSSDNYHDFHGLDGSRDNFNLSLILDSSLYLISNSIETWKFCQNLCLIFEDQHFFNLGSWKSVSSRNSKKYHKKNFALWRIGGRY